MKIKQAALDEAHVIMNPINKTHRVYDNRTDETLFEGENGLSCGLWIADNIPEDDERFEYVWIKRLEQEVRTDD